MDTIRSKYGASTPFNSSAACDGKAHSSQSSIVEARSSPDSLFCPTLCCEFTLTTFFIVLTSH